MANHLTSADETFLAEAADVCRRRIQVGAWALTAILLVAFVVGRVVLRNRPENAPGQLYMPLMILVCLSCLVILHFFRARKIHPVILVMPCVLAISAFAGTMLGALGGLDGPYFYAAYLLPPFFLMLPMPITIRIVGTVGSLATFVFAFYWMQPTIWEHPMVHIPILYLLAITSFNILMGHEIFSWHLERSSLLVGLEGQRSELLARNQWLKTHSERRIKDAMNLADELAGDHARVRRDVGRELHDDLAQIILATRLHVDALAQGTLAGRTDMNVVEAMNGALAALDEQTRRAIRALQTGTSRPLGFEQVVTAALKNHPLDPSVEKTVASDLRDRVLSSDAAELVRSAVREGVTNAIKHAAPTRIEVRVEPATAGAKVVVENDGNGLPRDVEDRGGFGVRGLRELAREVGAEVSLTGGEVTRLEVELFRSAFVEQRAE